MRTQRKACATEFSCKEMCSWPSWFASRLPAVAKPQPADVAVDPLAPDASGLVIEPFQFLNTFQRSFCLTRVYAVFEYISDICQSLRPLRKGRSRSSGRCHNKGRSSCESSQSNASDHCGARHGFQIRTEPEEAAVKWALEKKTQDALHVRKQKQTSPWLMQLLGNKERL